MTRVSLGNFPVGTLHICKGGFIRLATVRWHSFLLTFKAANVFKNDTTNYCEIQKIWGWDNLKDWLRRVHYDLFGPLCTSGRWPSSPSTITTQAWITVKSIAFSCKSVCKEQKQKKKRPKFAHIPKRQLSIKPYLLLDFWVSPMPCLAHLNTVVWIGRDPWTSGYGRRLVF